MFTVVGDFAADLDFESFALQYFYKGPRNWENREIRKEAKELGSSKMNICDMETMYQPTSTDSFRRLTSKLVKLLNFPATHALGYKWTHFQVIRVR